MFIVQECFIVCIVCILHFYTFIPTYFMHDNDIVNFTTFLIHFQVVYCTYVEIDFVYASFTLNPAEHFHYSNRLLMNSERISFLLVLLMCVQMCMPVHAYTCTPILICMHVIVCMGRPEDDLLGATGAVSSHHINPKNQT